MSQIVGICNISPESFSDGELVQQPLSERIDQLIKDGADIIDLGAVSTAPGSPDIDEQQELSRVQQALAVANTFTHTAFSVDTTRSVVAQYAIEHGVKMINDVSGGRADPQMYNLVAKTGVQYVLMYSKNPSGKADANPIVYPDGILAHIIDFFDTQIAIAQQHGVKKEQIVLDPGMGAFVSQDPQDSIDILHAIPYLKEKYAMPIYICTSRKGFLGKIATDHGPKDRVGSSLATSYYAILQGATYIRIHDVRWMRQLWTIMQQL